MQGCFLKYRNELTWKIDKYRNELTWKIDLSSTTWTWRPGPGLDLLHPIMGKQAVKRTFLLL